MQKRLLTKAATSLLVAIMTLAGCKKDEDPVNNPVKVSGVSLNKTTLTLAEGGSETLTATVAPADAENKAVTWKSDKTDIATVDANGKVTAVKAGTATITVTTADGGLTATCAVTVTAGGDGDEPVTIPVTEVSLSRTTATLATGSTIQLTATITPGNADNKAVTWTSDKTDIATVDASGKVTAINEGTAIITVTTADGGKTATCTITVDDDAPPTIPVTGVRLISATSLNLKVGDKSDFMFIVEPANATNRDVTVKYTNSNVVSVSAGMVVTATSAGVSVITVTTVDGGYTAQCTVTVTEDVQNLTYEYIDGKMNMEDEDGNPLVFTYTAAGAFPSGEYMSDWDGSEEDGYRQTKIVLNSNKTFYMDVRDATDAAGENIFTDWQGEIMSGTYTYTGTQSTGGTITLTIKSAAVDY